MAFLKFGALGWNPEFNIAALPTAAREMRIVVVEHCERVLCCDPAGEVAVTILWTEEPPEIAIPANNDPGSDMFRVRALVRAIRGCDDEEYQMEMQARCAEILMNPRMLEAIIVAASFLYEREEMDGGDVEDIFRALSAPQFGFGSLAS
jgi:hypothetical protein